MLSIPLGYIGLVTLGVLLSGQSTASAEDRFGQSVGTAASRRDDGTSRDRDSGGTSGHTGRGSDSRGRDGGGDLVGTMTGLPPQGETAERTAVEGRTATAQIEVVTETSLIGRGRLNRHAQPFPWVRSCQSAATEGWHYCGSP